MDCRSPGSSVHGISQQEYWEGFPFPSPGDIPRPAIKPEAPALAGGFFTTEPPGKPSQLMNKFPIMKEFPISMKACLPRQPGPCSLSCWRSWYSCLKSHTFVSGTCVLLEPDSAHLLPTPVLANALIGYLSCACLRFVSRFQGTVPNCPWKGLKLGRHEVLCFWSDRACCQRGTDRAGDWLWQPPTPPLSS